MADIDLYTMERDAAFRAWWNDGTRVDLKYGNDWAVKAWNACWEHFKPRPKPRPKEVVISSILDRLHAGGMYRTSFNSNKVLEALRAEIVADEI